MTKAIARDPRKYRSCAVAGQCYDRIAVNAFENALALCRFVHVPVRRRRGSLGLHECGGSSASRPSLRPMFTVAIGFALGVPASTETEDATVREAVAQRVDDFEVADQVKRAGVHDLTFDD